MHPRDFDPKVCSKCLTPFTIPGDVIRALSDAGKPLLHRCPSCRATRQQQEQGRRVRRDRRAPLLYTAWQQHGEETEH